MSETARIWFSLICLALITLMAGLSLCWYLSHVLKERRRRRAAQLMAARFRQRHNLPADASHATSRPDAVMVDQLIARHLAEGLPVQLNWEDDAVESREDGSDWPTGLLPRVRPADLLDEPE